MGDKNSTRSRNDNQNRASRRKDRPQIILFTENVRGLKRDEDLEAALASDKVDALTAAVSDSAQFEPMVAKRKQIVEEASERLRELVIEALEASMQAGESEALARALGQARRVPRSASRPKFDEALQRAEQALRSLTERAERTAQQIWDTAGSVGAVVSATKLTFDPMSQGDEEAGAAAEEEEKVSDIYVKI